MACAFHYVLLETRNHHTHTLYSPLFRVRHILRKRYSEEVLGTIICVRVTLISINIFHSPCIQLTVKQRILSVATFLAIVDSEVNSHRPRRGIVGAGKVYSILRYVEILGAFRITHKARDV